jgi:hydroxyacylglutathione hydrolase
MKFLHSMIRVSDPDATVAFFQLLGLEERRRMKNEAGRFTLIFLGVPGDDGGEVELTWNWDESGYAGGRNFGHLAYQVDDIYETCRRLMENGVTINRPPRDGRMAFVRSPDAISIEGGRARSRRAVGVDVQHGGMVMLDVVAVPAFADNYLWLVHDKASGETAVVDPGDAAPVLAEAVRRGWTITQVWNTHWHPDHTGGNLAIKAATGARISGPAAENIPGSDVALKEGDEVRLGDHVGRVIEVPGHTLGHVALIFDGERVAFVGDTLFAMGCGRLFEGTPEQMYRSLQRLTALPPETRLYCAHEYTLSNARFAVHAAPGDAAIAERLAEVEALRDEGRMTVPTTVAQERETNVFVRAADPEEFARLRRDKDSFRS